MQVNRITLVPRKCLLTRFKKIAQKDQFIPIVSKINVEERTALGKQRLIPSISEFNERKKANLFFPKNMDIIISLIDKDYLFAFTVLD